jgi:hypothetical protein
MFDSSYGNSGSSTFRSILTSDNRNLDFNGVSARVYAQHALRWLSERDHIFFSGIGSYFSRDVRATTLQEDEQRSIFFSSSTPSSTGSRSQKDTSASLNQVRFTLSLGYVVRPTLDDIEVLFAINPIGTYSSEKNLTPSSFSLSSWSIGARIPLYASYTTSEWCRIFGSFVYGLSYGNSESTNERFLSGNRSGSGFPDAPFASGFRSQIMSTGLFTTQLFNLGTDLRHKSGVNV